MPFQIIKGDITKIEVDAVVNAANESLLGGGGVDGAIHYAAGPELLKECRTLGGCRTGEAKITKGYNMPCRYIIHTPGPVWQGGDRGEPELLYSCYHEALKLADVYKCESIAFPLISSGIFGYPKDKALEVAERAIKDFLDEHDMLVTLVIYSYNDFELDREIKRRVSLYIGRNLERTKSNGVTAAVGFHGAVGSAVQGSLPKADLLSASAKNKKSGEFHLFRSEKRSSEKKAKESAKSELHSESEDDVQFVDFDACVCEESFKVLDLSFSQTLLELIDKKGLKDSDVYKKANIDRRLFSKIRSDINYRPKKQTAVAFAIALELDMTQTADLLSKAGFILSDSILFDVIIKHYIETRNYDIFEINNVLFQYDQSLIGA